MHYGAKGDSVFVGMTPPVSLDFLAPAALYAPLVDISGAGGPGSSLMLEGLRAEKALASGPRRTRTSVPQTPLPSRSIKPSGDRLAQLLSHPPLHSPPLPPLERQTYQPVLTGSAGAATQSRGPRITPLHTGTLAGVWRWAQRPSREGRARGGDAPTPPRLRQQRPPFLSPGSHSS